MESSEKEKAHDFHGFVLCNYNMKGIGSPLNCGHISPVAGYHGESDRVLLLDVWKDIGKCWVPLDTLVNAMCTIDKASGDYRGFVMVTGVPLIKR